MIQHYKLLFCRIMNFFLLCFDFGLCCRCSNTKKFCDTSRRRVITNITNSFFQSIFLSGLDFLIMIFYIFTVLSVCVATCQPDLIFPLTLTLSGLPRIAIVIDEINHMFQVATFATGFELPLNDGVSNNATRIAARLIDGTLFEIPTTVRTNRRSQYIFNSGGTMGIGRGSFFARHFHSVMLLPRDAIGGARLIGSPNNPADYCVDREIFYTPYTRFGGIDARVELDWTNLPDLRPPLINTTTDVVVPPLIQFIVDSVMESDHLPGEIYESILNIIQSDPTRRITRGVSPVMVIGCSEELLNELPSIRYTFEGLNEETENFEPVMTVIHEPRDYLEPVEEGICFLKIRPGGHHNIFGMNFLSKVGVVFDHVNSRIGFCDFL